MYAGEKHIQIFRMPDENNDCILRPMWVACAQFVTSYQLLTSLTLGVNGMSFLIGIFDDYT